MGWDVYVTKWCQRDMDDLAEYILDNDSIETAEVILGKLTEAILSLESFPMRGRAVPELVLSGIDGPRELIVGPHRVLYDVSGKVVHVLAVLDSRRELESLISGRLGG